MPSKDWLKKHPKVQGYLTTETHAQLLQWMSDRHITRISEAVGIILHEYLSDSLPHAPSSSPTIQISESLEQRLKAVEALLKPKVVDPVIHQPPPPENKVNHPVIHKSELLGGLLTTGEAYAIAKSKGYDKSPGTFRRSLRLPPIPRELERIGLSADWQKRADGNIKDNRLKWLRFSVLSSPR
jgi:hypothetical protein